jgi:adenylate cyclase
MSRASNLQRTAGLGHWLAGEARQAADMDKLFDAFCHELLSRRLPVWRATLGLEILHPETSGDMVTWRAGNLETHKTARAGVLTNPSYVNSPTRIVDETNRPFRQRLEGAALEIGLLEELRAEGATDYVMFPLPFLDTSRTAAISFATGAAGGFTETDLAELEMAADLLSPYAESFVLRRVAIDLLDTYVGRQTGERIFAGRIERGDVEAITAAIWMADLRGFTRLADSLPREMLVSLLNDWFECLAVAAEAHGGEILKFMGDGLLAVFPTGDSEAAGCDRALDAAAAALRGIEDLNRLRSQAGSLTLEFGLAVHLGDVAYGNVGGRRRLDFTVIGPAINHASRLQELTKSLNRRLLVSTPVARATNRPLVNLGVHPLRDVAALHEVFTMEVPGAV